jgi:hypothetical protein
MLSRRAEQALVVQPSDDSIGHSTPKVSRSSRDEPDQDERARNVETLLEM